MLLKTNNAVILKTVSLIYFYLTLFLCLITTLSFRRSSVSVPFSYVSANDPGSCSSSDSLTDPGSGSSSDP